jgi:hypothetical protein
VSARQPIEVSSEFIRLIREDGWHEHGDGWHLHGEGGRIVERGDFLEVHSTVLSVARQARGLVRVLAGEAAKSAVHAVRERLGGR